MAVSKKLDQIASIDILEYIRKNVCEIDEGRITAAVESIRKTNDIASLQKRFSDLNNKFSEESDELESISHGYIDQYASAHNGRYSTAYNTLTLIKTQIFFLYTLLGNLSENNQRPGYPHKNTRDIDYKVGHSYLGHLPYSPSIFDNKTETQKRLISEIETFLYYLNKNLLLCEEIVKEEERVGNDIDESKLRFDRQLNEIFELIKEDNSKAKKINAPYYLDLLNAEKNPLVYKTWYHNIKPAQMLDVARGIKNINLSKYSPLERKVFKEDLNKLVKFRTTVEHIDEMGKITGEVLICIYYYTKCNSSIYAFYNCFIQTYKELGGKQEIVSAGRLYQVNTGMLYKDSTLYPEFEWKMNNYCTN